MSRILAMASAKNIGKFTASANLRWKKNMCLLLYTTVKVNDTEKLNSWHQ
jgi:hypothetical protein